MITPPASFCIPRHAGCFGGFNFFFGAKAQCRLCLGHSASLVILLPGMSLENLCWDKQEFSHQEFSTPLSSIQPHTSVCWVRAERWG